MLVRDSRDSSARQFSSVTYSIPSADPPRLRYSVSALTGDTQSRTWRVSMSLRWSTILQTSPRPLERCYRFLSRPDRTCDTVEGARTARVTRPHPRSTPTQLDRLENGIFFVFFSLFLYRFVIAPRSNVPTSIVPIFYFMKTLKNTPKCQWNMSLVRKWVQQGRDYVFLCDSLAYERHIRPVVWKSRGNFTSPEFFSRAYTSLFRYQRPLWRNLGALSRDSRRRMTLDGSSN